MTTKQSPPASCLDLPACQSRTAGRYQAIRAPLEPIVLVPVWLSAGSRLKPDNAHFLRRGSAVRPVRAASAPSITITGAGTGKGLTDDRTTALLSHDVTVKSRCVQGLVSADLTVSVSGVLPQHDELAIFHRAFGGGGGGGDVFLPEREHLSGVQAERRGGGHSTAVAFRGSPSAQVRTSPAGGRREIHRF